MRVLILDDDELRLRALARMWKRGNEVVTVAGYFEAVGELSKDDTFDIVSLDYDLGRDTDFTGLDVVAFIVGMTPERRPKEVICHSGNPDYAQEMLAALHGAGIVCHTSWLRSERHIG